MIFKCQNPSWVSAAAWTSHLLPLISYMNVYYHFLSCQTLLLVFPIIYRVSYVIQPPAHFSKSPEYFI